MKKLFFYISIMLFAFVSCNKTNDVKHENSSPDKTYQGGINIAVMPTIDCLPFYIAEERGWFAESKLPVNLVAFTAHMDIDTALVGGSVDGAFTELFRTENIVKKQKVRFYYATSTELQWSLVANKDTRLTRLEQLGDKMVATTRFSATDYLTDEAFTDVKTKAMVYRVQINDIGVRYAMLTNNQMDTGWFPEPYLTKTVMKGHRVLKTAKVKDKFGVLAFRQKYANDAKNKEIVSSLMKIYDRACDSINKYGVVSYAPEMLKYCDADTAVVNNMPKITFIHTEKPDEATLAKVREYLK